MNQNPVTWEQVKIIAAGLFVLWLLYLGATALYDMGYDDGRYKDYWANMHEMIPSTSTYAN